MRRAAGLLLILAAVAAFIIAIAPSNSDSSTNRSSDDNPPIQISSDILYSSYQTNEIAADLEYKGKVLEVSGLVAAVRKDFADDSIVELSTKNQFEPVDAHINKDSVSFAATLYPGNPVTVLCRGGGMIIGRPMLKDCSIK